MNSISVYSDLICPWCFIGKRRMEAALRQLPSDAKVSITWHPFQLNPDMPTEGMNRKIYRSRKFGSWEQSQKLDEEVATTGKTVGIEFRYDLQTDTPNTFDAHRLVWFAGVSGVQDAVVEALFRGYFCEGVNFSDRTKLVDVAVSSGLQKKEVERFLSSDEGFSAVRDEEQHARELGISGVPLYIINEKVSFSGAQRPEIFLEAIRKVSELTNKTGEPKSTKSSDDCGPDGCKITK